jgi:hypothetical protein
LLSHGVWAFKVTGQHEATDLVCSDRLEPKLGLIQRTARTVALTEWKLVRENDDPDAKAEEARTQAGQYASGVLGAVELKRTRYVVLVTIRDIAAPPDVDAERFLYRHVVVPVRPETPSVNARHRPQKRRAK